MKHPEQANLALHAGGDLGWWSARKTARHVARCGECRDEVAAFEGMREMLPELNQLPGVPWNRIASEMRANIRLGLVAGECVREAEAPVREMPLFNFARTAIATASAVALVVTGLVLVRPVPSVMASGPMVQVTFRVGSSVLPCSAFASSATGKSNSRVISISCFPSSAVIFVFRSIVY